MRRLLILALGPLLALLTLLLPLPPAERRVAALTAWMVAWWLTEAVPLGVTSLLPLALLPALGVLTPKEASAPYANELIFLFLAGFLLARALEHWKAHERLAYGIVARTGLGGPQMLLGLMLATGLLSMFVSNTATAAMMYPIALALGGFVPADAAGDRTRTALMLGIAFAASIGGIGTLIGTPPNLIMAAAAESLTGRHLGFGEYLLIGVPAVLVLLPAAWALLAFGTCRGMAAAPPAAAAVLRERHAALGPLVGSERRVVAIFALTALAWVWPGEKPFSDAAIGLLGATLLFVVPAGAPHGDRPLLAWDEARSLPWDVLLLFGGGLSLAAGMEASGLTARLAGSLAGLGGSPRPVIYLALAALVVALSEIASNTAVAALMMPLVASLGGATGIPTIELIVVTGLAASAGFALPVATPPNAIAFGSGLVPVRTMARTGIWLDLIAILVVVLLASLLVPLVVR
ncbi:MAG TPA: DASS family sodium-coupled anion symporter [Gemmatimonadales bacterium]|nr:DASS family sodium-coupled anion symporter [Gemmatimonadales bacterium]